MEMSEQPRERRSVPRTITPLSVPAVNGPGILRFPLKHEVLSESVRSALDEDGAFDDVTTIATVVSDRRSRGTLMARENGVVCGIPLALEAFRLLDPKVSIRVDREDGSRVRAGEPVLFVTGHARGLLSAERVEKSHAGAAVGARSQPGLHLANRQHHSRLESENDCANGVIGIGLAEGHVRQRAVA